MIEAVEQEAREQMQQCIESLELRLNKIRTGRASPELLSNVKASYYGNDTPLLQLASVAVEGAKTLVVTAWDKEAVSAIEKAILTSDLGVNPNVAGQVIRITLPPLTETRRKSLASLVHKEGEQACVTVRHARRHANQQLKDMLKAKEMSEDDERRAQGSVQKLTDEYISKVDQLVKLKEREVMTV